MWPTGAGWNCGSRPKPANQRQPADPRSLAVSRTARARPPNPYCPPGSITLVALALLANRLTLWCFQQGLKLDRPRERLRELFGIGHADAAGERWLFERLDVVFKTAHLGRLTQLWLAPWLAQLAERQDHTRLSFYEAQRRILLPVAVLAPASLRAMGVARSASASCLETMSASGEIDSPYSPMISFNRSNSTLLPLDPSPIAMNILCSRVEPVMQ